MAVSDDNFIPEIFLNRGFSKTAATMYLSFKFEVTHIYISDCDIMLKRNEFLLIFVSQTFPQKV